MLDVIGRWQRENQAIRLVVNYANNAVRAWEGTIISWDASGVALRVDDRGRSVEMCFPWNTATEITPIIKR